MSVAPFHKAGQARGARVRELQAQARLEALTHSTEMLADMLALQALAQDVADGGEAYPVGVRNIARLLAASLDVDTDAIQAILQRHRHG